MVKSFRDELTDHIIIYNEAHLRKILFEYISYYNNHRVHSAIDFNAPKRQICSQVYKFDPIKIVRKSILSGLITDFSLVA